MYNMDTQELIAFHMRCFDIIRRCNYFKGKPIRRTEVEVRMGKFINGKAASKCAVTGEIVKGGTDMVMDWNCRLCNMAFNSRLVPED